MRECIVCHDNFKPHRGQVSCSHACANIYQQYQNAVVRECETCGVLFMTHKSWMTKGIIKYCSRKCFGISISKEKNGKCLFCGKIFYASPSRIANGHGKYCSNSCSMRSKTGKDSHAWKGGTSPENNLIRSGFEYRKWREAVFSRDNWTCQDCKKRGTKLHAHHVFSFSEFPEHRFEIWNGITLCRICHAKCHPAQAKWLRNETSGHKC